MSLFLSKSNEKQKSKKKIKLNQIQINLLHEKKIKFFRKIT